MKKTPVVGQRVAWLGCNSDTTYVGDLEIGHVVEYRIFEVPRKGTVLAVSGNWALVRVVDDRGQFDRTLHRSELTGLKPKQKSGAV